MAHTQYAHNYMEVPTPGSPTLAYNTGRLRLPASQRSLNAECAVSTGFKNGEYGGVR